MRENTCRARQGICQRRPPGADCANMIAGKVLGHLPGLDEPANQNILCGQVAAHVRCLFRSPNKSHYDFTATILQLGLPGRECCCIVADHARDGLVRKESTSIEHGAGDGDGVMSKVRFEIVRPEGREFQGRIEGGIGGKRGGRGRGLIGVRICPTVRIGTTSRMVFASEANSG